ncbi:MAG TPA: tetratricopeptide repeat protein [Candidatus Xenobia bacterium]|jgi:tetratricopeptide (TPR) repeat protein/CHAT domain-containing protein
MPEPPSRKPVDHSLVESLQLLLGEKVDANDRTLLEGVAELYIQLGRTAEGLQCLREAKNLHRKTFDYQGDARVLRKLGQVFLQRGDKVEAQRVWQQSIHASRDIDDRAGEAAALDLLAGLLEQEDRHAEAVTAFEETLAIKSAAGDQVGQARTLTRLGGTHMALGQHQEALRCLRQAVRIWKTEPNRLKECECLEEIVACYLALGRFVDLVRAAEELLELNDALGRKADRSSIYMPMATAWRCLGRWQESLRLYGLAVDAARQEKVRPRLISALLAQGRALRHTDRSSEALRLLHAAETEAKAGDGRHLVGDVLLELGTVYMLANQPGEANKILREAAKLLQTAGAEDRAASALVLVAGAVARLGPLPEAEAHLVTAHGLAQGAGDTQLLAVINSFRGTLLWSLGRADEALRWLRNGLELMDDPAAIGRDHPEHVLGPTALPFEGAVHLSLQRGEVQYAFQAAQAAHAHAAVAATERLSVPDKSANGGGPVGQCERIVAQIRGCNSRLETLHDHRTRGQVRQQLQALRSELRGHREAAQQQHPEYAALRFFQSMGVEEVQALLPERTALLAWLVGGHQTWLWLVTADELIPFVQPVGRADLQRLVHALTSGLEQADQAQATAEIVQALSAALFSGVAEHLENHTRLLVVPDDVLTDVPFAVLTTPRGEALANRFDLAWTPTIPSWQVCRKRGKHSGLARATRKVMTATIAPQTQTVRPRGLLGGSGPGTPFPPPPGSAAVVDTNSPSSVIEVRSSHKMEEFETMVRKASMLHISAPIELHGEAAFGSTFTLQDGGVSLQHMAHLSFTTHLLLLSATRAARWPAAPGTAWRTLTLPLMYAGLSSVVFTRWQVDEGARRLFADTLFTQLQAGDSKAEAVREARARLMSHRTYANPHYWGAFELFGDAGGD